MPLPSDIYDEGRNYRLRLSMLVSEAIAVAPSSKIHPCDGCGELIWVAEGQAIPPLPDGMELHGDLSICRHCAKKVNDEGPSPNDEPTFLDQPDATPEMREEARRYFGLGKSDSPLT